MVIQIQNCKLDVNVTQTKEYYASHALCDCSLCRNYYAQVAAKYPALGALLSPLGVDICRPDELGGIEMDEKIQYVFAAYTVAGKLPFSEGYETELSDGGTTLRVVIDRAYVPNEQKGDFFTVTVYNVILPWALDEPFPEKLPMTKRILEKIRTYLSKS